MEERFTLLELNHQIKEGIKIHFPDNYWVIAEISELKMNRRGHCYLDLIEKDELDDRIMAKARGIIWASTFRMLKPYFETTTGKELQEGLKILINVTIEFHELYGYSLYVYDIDPTYTLGDLARRKLETIKRLEEEGILNMNKELPFPEVPQKIAIISSQTAAGYKDFMEQLTNNPYGYIFYTKLFPAYMQGDEAESSIIQSLEKIFEFEALFDVVVIIRGGGAQSDLSCFDFYQVAANVAQFPIPVLTGIGHEKDESVVDMVAHTKLKTPTAVADFIINQTYQFEEQILIYRDDIIERVKEYLNEEKQKVTQITYRMVPATKNIIDRSSHQINLLTNNLKSYKKYFLEHKKTEIANHSVKLQNNTKNTLKQHHFSLEFNKQNLNKYVNNFLRNQQQKIKNYKRAKEYLDPQNILKRGFSITQANGKVLKSIQEISENQNITTILYEGRMDSKILNRYKSSGRNNE
jgi:exodeoxyribonuclease VII large subunit